MLTDTQTDEISEKIANLFQGMDLEDVAHILKIQMAMLVTQGTDDAEGAMEFLDEIYEDVEQMVEAYPFGEDGEDGDEDESGTETGDKPAN